MQKYLFLLATILLLAVAAVAQSDKSAKPEKNTVEEIVARHLASIGKPEDIAAARSRVFVGDVVKVEAASAAATAKERVPVQFATEGNRLLLAMLFGKDGDAAEKAAFDGDDQSLSFPGESSLGRYFKDKKQIIKLGFLGGALSSAWPLLDLKTSKIKLSYEGLFDANGKKYHRLKYAPAGAFIKVLMYFEADTFRHTVTEYEYIGDGSGTIRSGMKAEVHRMIEMFADFKMAGKLTLPMRYSISRADGDFKVFTIPGMGRGLPYESQDAQSSIDKGSTSLSYLINFSDVYFNETLDPAVFKLSKK